jgi:hypothetical protein
METNCPHCDEKTVGGKALCGCTYENTLLGKVADLTKENNSFRELFPDFDFRKYSYNLDESSGWRMGENDITITRTPFAPTLSQPLKCPFCSSKFTEPHQQENGDWWSECPACEYIMEASSRHGLIKKLDKRSCE